MNYMLRYSSLALILGLVACSVWNEPMLLLDEEIAKVEQASMELANYQSTFINASDRMKWIDEPLVIAQAVEKLPEQLSHQVANFAIYQLSLEQVYEFLAESLELKISSPNLLASDENDSPAPGIDFSYHNGTVEGLLDEFCQSQNLAWAWRDEMVYIYDRVTLVFQLPAVSALMASDTRNIIDSQTQHQASNQLFWQQLAEDIAHRCLVDCEVHIQDSTSSLTLSGKPREVAYAHEALLALVRKLESQIELQVTLLEITLREGNQLGLNWQLMSQSLGDAGIESQLQSSASGQSLIVSANTANQQQGLLSAFAQQGGTSVVTSPRGVTMHQQPLEIALVTQTAYLQSITSTALNDEQSISATGLTPGVIESGFTLLAIPSIDQDLITLQLGIKLSSLEQINSVSSGDQSIQIPVITQSRYSHRVLLRHGQTLIIGGVSEMRKQSEQQLSLLDSEKSQVERVLLITPIIIPKVRLRQTYRDLPWWRQAS